jgi:hypothetical protein
VARVQPTQSPLPRKRRLSRAGLTSTPFGGKGPGNRDELNRFCVSATNLRQYRSTDLGGSGEAIGLVRLSGTEAIWTFDG